MVPDDRLFKGGTSRGGVIAHVATQLAAHSASSRNIGSK